MEILTLVSGSLACLLVAGFGLIVLWKIYEGDIDLSRLISEPTGDASMSRFQLLVFTFVIALSLFLIIVSADKPSFPYVPPTILTLLGISGSSYLVSKGIQFSDPAGITDRAAEVVISPATAIVRYGQTQQFKAEVPRKPGSPVTWQVIAGYGTVDANGLYTAPTTPPAGLAPGTQAHATIQVTSNEFPDASDLAVVTLSGNSFVINPAKATVAYGQSQQFKAEVSGKPGLGVKWQVLSGQGKIDANGLYTAPPAAPAGLAAGTQARETIQATSIEFPDVSDLAVVTLS
jgi:hypothetical protein